MRVITRRALQTFAASHSDAKQSLDAWYDDASRASWATPVEIKAEYPTASILPGNWVVFNIRGNNYRLVVKVHYNTGHVFVRFIGTHAEYDRIDATTI